MNRSAIPVAALVIAIAQVACNDGDPAGVAPDAIATRLQAAVTPLNPAITPVFADNFETGAKAKSAGGKWTMVSGPVAVCKGGARGSVYALCLTHKATLDGRMSFAEQRFALTNGVQDLWISYDYWVPGNFFHRLRSTDNNENNKFLALWEENYTGKSSTGAPTPVMLFEFRPMNDLASHPGEVGASYLYAHGRDRTGKKIGGIGNKWYEAWGPSTAGRWINVLVHVKLATTDVTNDGVIELWADNVLQISKYNFAMHSIAKGHYIRNGYFIGWANSGYSQQTVFKIDNVKIFNRDPR